MRLIILLTILSLFGCSGTMVVLVPDNYGKLGEVDVQTKGATLTLSKQNESTSVSDPKNAPQESEIITDADLKSEFNDLIDHQLKSPERFSLDGFVSGSSDVSKYDDVLIKIADLIKTKNTCSVIIIGNSDTVGTNEINSGIAKARANAVRNSLIQLGIKQECIPEVRFYGESDLAVLTDDNVDEPKNRRVEVEVR